MADPIADREILVTRLLDAPRELVFAAFTEREHVESWWVPEGTTFHEYDVRADGLWRYTQPGPGGAEYPFKITFIELDSPARLIYDFGTDAQGAPDPVRTTVTLEERGEKTLVTLQLLFPTAAAREEAAKHGAQKGAVMALKNLADYLEKK